jgi:type VI secretion system protein VasG
MLLALLDNEDFARMLIASSETLKKISVETLKESLMDLTAGSVEDVGAAVGTGALRPLRPANRPVGRGPRHWTNIPSTSPNGPKKVKSTRCWAVISKSARWWIFSSADGRTTPFSPARPVSARPLWSKGFALRIAEGMCRPNPSERALHTLDLGLLQAGAGIKGEFENRLKGVINEVKASPIPIILFIDEAHTLIGAGGQAGLRGCGQPAQTRAGPRRTAHHRRHHLG